MTSSSELRDYATVVTATVALLVFFANAFSQIRNRRVANLSRFNEAHRGLFAEEGYIARNLVPIESGTLQRDRNDPEMEAKFHLMLLEIERLAILANNRAVPRHTQVYMFGSYARGILKVISAEERNSMFWELALGYLDELAKDTETYAKLDRSKRERFWR
jgi:hypothetical protein